MFDELRTAPLLSGGHKAFRLICPDGAPPTLFPVRHPGTVLPDDLQGCQGHIAAFRKNLDGFQRRLPPVPALLYGSRGTGKTSLVLALWNDWNRLYPSEPLKIIQADRQGIGHLPFLVDHLSECPGYFLLLLDDLTFPAEDASFQQFKALLDGGIIASPDNAGLVVTTNIRHMVEESRNAAADALHPEELRDSALALHDRFGLTLFFEEPDQENYLALVLSKAIRAGLLPAASGDWKDRFSQWLHAAENTPLSPSDPEIRILQQSLGFSRARGSRSGRTAQRFVDLLVRDLI